MADSEHENQDAQEPSENIDDLLIDLKNLLSDEEEPSVHQKDRTLRQKLEMDREATRIYDERYASIIRGASQSADKAVGHSPDELPEEEDKPDSPPSFGRL